MSNTVSRSQHEQAGSRPNEQLAFSLLHYDCPEWKGTFLFSIVQQQRVSRTNVGIYRAAAASNVTGRLTNAAGKPRLSVTRLTTSLRRTVPAQSNIYSVITSPRQPNTPGQSTPGFHV